MYVFTSVLCMLQVDSSTMDVKARRKHTQKKIKKYLNKTQTQSHTVYEQCHKHHASPVPG